MAPHQPNPDPTRDTLSVLLIGNYPPDQQESMQRFARLLKDQLSKRKIRVELIQPQVVCGQFGNPHRGIGKWLGYIDKFILFPLFLKKQISRWHMSQPGPKVVHICDQANSIYTRHLQSIPHLVTCCDLLAIRSAQGEIPQHSTRWSGLKLQQMILNGLNRAHRVTCISEATRRDLLRLSTIDPAATDVTPMGLNYHYSPMPLKAAQNMVSDLVGTTPSDLSSQPYLLHVGGNQWYKNRLGVLRIFSQLRGDHPDLKHKLIMAGKPFTPEMTRFVNANRLGREVISIQGCSNEQLRALYSAAQLLLFPSLEEGFGWPIIEAQACACPVVTTNKPPMSNIGGPSAVYINPEHLPSATESIYKLLNENQDDRKARVTAGIENTNQFSPAKMIESYLQIYSELEQGTSTDQRPASNPPMHAVFGSLPKNWHSEIGVRHSPPPPTPNESINPWP